MGNKQKHSRMYNKRCFNRFLCQQNLLNTFFDYFWKIIPIHLLTHLRCCHVSLFLLIIWRGLGGGWTRAFKTYLLLSVSGWHHSDVGDIMTHGRQICFPVQFSISCLCVSSLYVHIVSGSLWYCLMFDVGHCLFIPGQKDLPHS